MIFPEFVVELCQSVQARLNLTFGRQNSAPQTSNVQSQALPTETTNDLEVENIPREAWAEFLAYAQQFPIGTLQSSGYEEIEISSTSFTGDLGPKTVQSDPNNDGDKGAPDGSNDVLLPSLLEEHPDPTKPAPSSNNVTPQGDARRVQKNGDLLKLILKQLAAIARERDNAVAELKADNRKLQHEAAAANIRCTNAESAQSQLEAEKASLTSRIETFEKEDRQAEYNLEQARIAAKELKEIVEEQRCRLEERNRTADRVLTRIQQLQILQDDIVNKIVDEAAGSDDISIWKTVMRLTGRKARIADSINSGFRLRTSCSGVLWQRKHRDQTWRSDETPGKVSHIHISRPYLRDDWPCYGSDGSTRQGKHTESSVFVCLSKGMCFPEDDICPSSRSLSVEDASVARSLASFGKVPEWVDDRPIHRTCARIMKLFRRKADTDRFTHEPPRTLRQKAVNMMSDIEQVCFILKQDTEVLGKVIGNKLNEIERLEQKLDEETRRSSKYKQALLQERWERIEEERVGYSQRKIPTYTSSTYAQDQAPSHEEEITPVRKERGVQHPHRPQSMRPVGDGAKGVGQRMRFQNNTKANSSGNEYKKPTPKPLTEWEKMVARRHERNSRKVRPREVFNTPDPFAPSPSRMERVFQWMRNKRRANFDG
ncbi:hypothetical protein BWQ96_03822 [Gracilariopsis chorda]|uniref:Uncharacterized protein n=1 Tax=Gracilariopsis chorda TaxID=448386 RepID=A0A2V3IWB1_9FLOR|nr:hypothetical protein BWQ96_03821 [Gracilariopsis chorda]PXF46428.1 hypothetical protein BWQ96_03822 [Gracilariopsis chorda]|eukprot:PXF46427.1 hypothetical protein BWQ96_03821 [Gracilariopsis chorda]